MVNKSKDDAESSNIDKDLLELVNQIKIAAEYGNTGIELSLIQNGHDALAKGLQSLKAGGMLKGSAKDHTLLYELAYWGAEDLQIEIAKDRELLLFRENDRDQPPMQALILYGSEKVQLQLLKCEGIFEGDSSGKLASLFERHCVTDTVKSELEKVLGTKPQGSSDSQAQSGPTSADQAEQYIKFIADPSNIAELRDLIKNNPKKLFEKDGNGESIACRLTAESESVRWEFLSNRALLPELLENGNTIGYQIATYARSAALRLEFAKDDSLLGLKGKGGAVVHILALKGPDEVFDELMNHRAALKLKNSAGQTAEYLLSHDNAVPQRIRDVLAGVEDAQQAQQGSSEDTSSTAPPLKRKQASGQKLERDWKKDVEGWVSDYNAYITKHDWAKQAASALLIKYDDKLMKCTLSLSEALELYNAVQVEKSKRAAIGTKGMEYFGQDTVSALADSKRKLADGSITGKSLSEMVDDAHEIYKRDLLFSMLRNEELERYIMGLDKERHRKFKYFHDNYPRFKGINLFHESEFYVQITESDWDWLFFAINNSDLGGPAGWKEVDNLRAPLRPVQEEQETD